MPLLTTGVGKFPAIAGGGGDSAEYTAFIARTSGLDGTHTSAYQALINGLVSDSLWSKFDLLYIFATQDSTTAKLNLISTSFGITENGSPNFSADNGYIGVDASTTVYLDTGFNSSTAGGVFTQNSAHASIWSLTNVAGGASGGCVLGIEGVGAVSKSTRIFPKYADGNFYGDITDSSIGTMTVANSDARGHYQVNRSGATATQAYRNASSIATSTSTSDTRPNVNFFILTNNVDGVGPGFGAAYRTAMCSVGSSMNSTEQTNFYNRLRTYMTAVGVP